MFKMHKIKIDKIQCQKDNRNISLINSESILILLSDSDIKKIIPSSMKSISSEILIQINFF